MNKCVERLYNGIIKENPTLVLTLGMCPTLAVTTSAINGIGMGLGFTCAITILGAIRELLGGGTILSTGSSALVDLSNFGYTPASIFILAPGAFFVLAMCVAVMYRVKRKHGMKPAEVPDYVSDEEKEN